MSTPHIFVAEDDPDVRTSIAEVLRDEGYDVGEFENLEAALVELQAGARPCLVLTDLLMPGMTGSEFLDEVRKDQALSDVPIVLMTGAKIAAPAVAVLRKPFDLSDLVAVVEKHCIHVRSGDDRPQRGRRSPNAGREI